MIKQAISILGPTASGKSALALALAQADPKFVLVNADSQQVYQGMRIGTSSPRDLDLAVAPHVLYNHHSPDTPYDLGIYLREVEKFLETLKEDAIPIFVGGAGFYQRGLWQGLPPVPKDSVMRETLHREWETRGAQALYDELRERDPTATRSIHPRNKVRLLRALEVIRLTGEPFSAHKVRHCPIAPLQGTRFLKLGLSVDRALLYRRVSIRVREMIDEGLIEEVRALMQKWGANAWALTRSVGYRESLLYLKGDLGLEETIADIEKNTRHYAKRQMTWFNREPDIVWGTKEELIGVVEGWKKGGGPEDMEAIWDRG